MDAAPVKYSNSDCPEDVGYPEFPAIQFRQTLNMSVINMFNKGSTDPSSSTILSNFSKFIKCFRHCLEEFPQIFVSCERNSDAQCIDIALAFSEWLLMRLLRVLSLPYTTVVHDGCIDLFISLLQVVRSHDLNDFQRYSLSLLHLMCDLISFSETSFIQTMDPFVIEQYFAKGKNGDLKVKETEGLDLSDIPIVINDHTECEHLQIKLTQLLQKLSANLLLFLPDQYCSFWNMLLQQVENGALELKDVSLEAITHCIETEGFPPSETCVNYALDCLNALVFYCCSVDCENISFENSIAHSLIALTKALQEDMVYPTLNEFFFTQVFEKIILSVTTYGFTKLKSYELRSAIIVSILNITDIMTARGLSQSPKALELFQAKLYSQFGEIESHKFLITYFNHIIMAEIKESESSSKWNSTNATQILFGSTARQNASLSNFCSNLKLKSSTWSSVFDCLTTCLNFKADVRKHKLSVEKCASSINAINTCLEIVLGSALQEEANLTSDEKFIPIELFNTQKQLFSEEFGGYLINSMKTSFPASYICEKLIIRELIDFACCIICFQDLLHLTTEDYNFLASILSMPWVSSWKMHDFHFNPDVWLQQFSSSQASNDVSLMVKCMRHLSFLPQEICPQWRCFILRLCFEHQDESLRKTSVQELPVLAFLSLITEDDFMIIVQKSHQDDCTVVWEEIAKAVGKLSCVFDSSCVMCRTRMSDGSLKHLPDLTCNICDRGVFLKEHQTCDSYRHCECVSLSLTYAMDHSQAAVRQESLASLSSFFVHNEIKLPMLHKVIAFIADPDYEVRNNFCNVIQNVLKHITRDSNACRWTAEMDEILVTKLKTVLNEAKSKRNHRMLETTLSTICEIAKAADNQLLLICIISLLEHLLSTIPSIVVHSRFKMKEIAVAKHYSMPNLFKTYKEPICKFLAESMYSCGSDLIKAINALKEIHSIFGYKETKSFLSVTQQYILPYLVSRDGSNICTPLLKVLAESMGTNKRDLLLNNFPFIFSHLVRFCKKPELEKSLLFVQKETDLEFGSLLRCNYQLTHNELLLHISTHYDNVFAGLATLALNSDEQQGSDVILTTRDDMATYLQPKLLGFLVYFDSQLLKSSITLEDKKLALKSLICIMELMGPKYITTVRFKIMATLRIALRFKDGEFPKICCQAWNTFVHSIDIASLGPLLNQVVVALLPLIEFESAAVAEILFFLIIKNQSNFKEFFNELYFIPDIPALQPIHSVLKEYTENPSSQADFQSILRHSLKGVSHENIEVRLHALEKLKQVLNKNQVSLHDHLLERESVDHLLSHLINIVITSCRESDSRTRNVLGECLGAMGAIDPGRLEIKNTDAKENSIRFFHNIDDENFAFSLIQKLTHSFLAAGDCRVQDCSAFAIQEVLQIYKYSHRSQSLNNKENIWSKFSPDIQEILNVLSNSQYRPLEKNKKSFPKPIYQSSLGSTFNDWVTNWFSSLVLKVKQEKAAKVFHVCCMIIKHDLNCVLFLLPHIVVYALIDSKEADNDIITEILAVLNTCEPYPSGLCRLSCQTIFSVIDHMSRWIRYKQQAIIESRTAGSTSKPNADPEFDVISSFMNKIPQLLLAKSSYYCEAYTRALMHLEQHLKTQPLEQELNFLQKLYAALDESDSVAGVASFRTGEVSLKDAILEHEAIGDMQAAFSCYEKAISIFPDEVSYYGGLLKCFLGMDQPSTAMIHANGIISERPQWEENLNCYRVEAAWKLANWDALDTFLENENSLDKWNVGVGKILHHTNYKDFMGFEEQIQAVCSSQMAPLSAASMENGAYLRGYEHLTHLHMLTDLQKSTRIFFPDKDCLSGDSSTKIDIVSNEWKERLDIVQSSLRYQEPILDLHRVLLKMGKVQYPDLSPKFDTEIASYWLKSAKLARKSGHQQRAYSCLLEAATVDSPEFFMEKTKWHWNKGEKEQAISCLQKGIVEHFSKCNQVKSNAENHFKTQLMCAKAKLLLAVYSEESAITDSNRLIQMYQDVLAVQPNWEESHFHLGKYFDKMLNAAEKQDSKPELMLCVANGFGSSLHHGCKHIYHSLPRLLDIWFDIGTQVVEHQNSRKTNTVKNLEAALSQMNSTVMPNLFSRLPLYLFLTALPQMISRICHSNSEVSIQLQKIIAKLLVEYSQQSMWMMIAVSKSSYPMRVVRCKKIFQEAVSLRPELSKFILDTTKLADKFIELSNKNVSEPTLSISENFQVLPKLFEDRNFSPIMIPLQSQMNVTLPSGNASNHGHNPFPFQPIYIHGFEDNVVIFPSLQRPKKLVIRGTDGKLYGIICKPKDDLRKDCRLMEFNNLVNRYLKSDPEARKRQLYIRTYGVIPLNEECGLIEWVQNLEGLRIITAQIYKRKGIFVSAREIKAMMPHRTATAEQKLLIFRTKFLPKFPPVFSEWFLNTFPDPTAWYLARLAYSHTTAVMSMVGYIIGLGDRHGENILFDSSCGDTVHVDLNCLFNKGEAMECPERVPFRLTHNMIHAMGPTGYEGVFRKACEVTMRVIRSRTDALMSVLRPFVYDPMVEWSKTRNSRVQPPSGEIRNEMGLTHVKDIELRLNGIIRSKNKPQGLPLSIEGQVNYLIQEATDDQNLSQMYIGWTPHV